MRILLLAALTLAGGGTPGVHTIAGTISANSGDSITISSADRSLTCHVLGARGQAVVLRWGTGVHAGMACKDSGDSLVLWRLVRLGVTEPGTGLPPNTDLPKTDPPSTSTPPSTAPKTEPPQSGTSPPATSQQRQYAIGVVVYLTGDGVAVKPDAGGEPFACSITGAPDSRAAAAKLSAGAHVGIVCRLDGGRWVLAGATPVT